MNLNCIVTPMIQRMHYKLRMLVWQETKHKDCRRAQEASKVHDVYSYVHSSKVAAGRHTC